LEERESPRVVTQRQLEVDAPRPDPPREPPPEASPSVPDSRPPIPMIPSNLGLLERRLRWFRERAKFESKPPLDEGSK